MRVTLGGIILGNFGPTVGIFTEVECVVAAVQNIAAIIFVIIAGQIVLGNGQGQGLAFTGSQQVGLIKSGQNNLGLLDAAGCVGSFGV